MIRYQTFKISKWFITCKLQIFERLANLLLANFLRAFIYLVHDYVEKIQGVWQFGKKIRQQFFWIGFFLAKKHNKFAKQRKPHLITRDFLHIKLLQNTLKNTLRFLTKRVRELTFSKVGSD